MHTRGARVRACACVRVRTCACGACALREACGLLGYCVGLCYGVLTWYSQGTHAAPGCATGYSRGTHRVLTLLRAVPRGTHGVLTGYSHSAGLCCGVLTGYSQGTHTAPGCATAGRQHDRSSVCRPYSRVHDPNMPPDRNAFTQATVWMQSAHGAAASAMPSAIADLLRVLRTMLDDPSALRVRDLLSAPTYAAPSDQSTHSTPFVSTHSTPSVSAE
jgi:hypothetical protein